MAPEDGPSASVLLIILDLCVLFIKLDPFFDLPIDGIQSFRNLSRHIRMPQTRFDPRTPPKPICCNIFAIKCPILSKLFVYFCDEMDLSIEIIRICLRQNFRFLANTDQIGKVMSVPLIRKFLKNHQ